MRGATVVLDSSNLAAVIEDATGEKPAEAVTEKVEPKAEPQAAAAKVEDESEDDNGLTEAQRKELTEKMQRAIGKKHRQMKEAEEFAASQYSERQLAEQRAEKFEREVKRLEAQKPQAEPIKDEAPQRDKFATDEEFSNAMIDYRVDQRLKKAQAEIAHVAEQARIELIRVEASKRVSKAKELVPDFEDTLSDADINVPPYIAQYMQESEMVAELGYHFAKNPAEMEKLEKMSPVRALVEIGKIESRLKPFGEKVPESATNGATPSKTVAEPSSEPKPRPAPPIAPLNGASLSGDDKPVSQMSYAEAKAAWQRQKGVSLNRRERH